MFLCCKHIDLSNTLILTDNPSTLVMKYSYVEGSSDQENFPPLLTVRSGTGHPSYGIRHPSPTPKLFTANGLQKKSRNLAKLG